MQIQQILYVIAVNLFKLFYGARYWFLLALGLCLLYAFAKHYSLKRIVYRRYFSAEGVFEGEEVILIEEVQNHCFLPLFCVDIQSHITGKLRLKHLRWQGDDIQEFISRFILLPYTAVRRSHPIICEKRGCYKLESAHVFFLKKEYTLLSEAHIFVYPAQCAFEWEHRLDAYLSALEPSHTPLFADPFSFAGVREYQPGDSFHNINFKVSARHAGKFYVNQMDYVTSRKFMLYLNFAAETEYSHEEYQLFMERALSYASYLLAKSQAAGYEIGFAANCHMYFGEKYLRYPIGASNHNGVYQALLKQMAEAVLRSERSIAALINMDIQEGMTNTEALLMTLVMDEQTKRAVGDLEKIGNSVHVAWLSKI